MSPRPLGGACLAKRPHGVRLIRSYSVRVAHKRLSRSRTGYAGYGQRVNSTPHRRLARAAAVLGVLWTGLIAVRLVVAAVRGQWTLAVVGIALLAGSAGMAAWAWTIIRSPRP